MKPGELMLGDWVVCFGCYTRVAEIDNDTIGFIMPQGGIHSVFKGYVEPVPITTDILKENGFGYVENDVNPYDKEVLSRFYLGEDGYCENMDVLIGTNNKGVFWFNCPKGSLNGIHYVHELQHALRLCNIDKEIEL